MEFGGVSQMRVLVESYSYSSISRQFINSTKTSPKPCLGLVCAVQEAPSTTGIVRGGLSHSTSPAQDSDPQGEAVLRVAFA